jgi:hypothetical protein
MLLVTLADPNRMSSSLPSVGSSHHHRLEAPSRVALDIFVEGGGTDALQLAAGGGRCSPRRWRPRRTGPHECAARR